MAGSAWSGCYLLMMYYTTVTGWMVSYFGRFLTGAFHGGHGRRRPLAACLERFCLRTRRNGDLDGACGAVGLSGVQRSGCSNGLERVSKIMMMALLALIVVLAVHSLTLPGAAEGMKFYLLPSMDSIRENGLGNLIMDADEPSPSSP